MGPLVVSITYAARRVRNIMLGCLGPTPGIGPSYCHLSYVDWGVVAFGYS